ncbi:hypothetical protein J5N97_014343 [Dioscorea zingiberensis]|uniref:Tyrosinase copper-binding domain-containing protein n=1 Tax=Dioscorea zingiberensis TaxID=325984 RepID=A0A9D5CTY2_9LILI|nr:hypothetical protein J5N97_014343 [Dioscorea zingiberensis]
MGLTTQSLASFLSATTSACPLGYSTTSKQPKLAAPSSTTSLNLVSTRVRCSLKDEQSRSSFLMDRRDMLVGLGGLYGATEGMLAANAAPLEPPDLDDKSACVRATENNIEKKCPGTDLLNCCPDYQGNPVTVKNYDFPKTTLRVRKPAQKVANDPVYMNKYKMAVHKMKGLPDEHPWNYYQQAKVHCAFCNEAYHQENGVPLQVHNSWIFLPWHRYYLHFYERILGKLIDDETFALPYWNFDYGDGMTMPTIFLDTTSPIYNERRDMDHYPPALVDYKYAYTDGDSGLEGDDLVHENLDYLRRTFKEGLPLPELFMGDRVRAGEEADATKSLGQLEAIHNALHFWVGPKESPHIDMGSFATAARDSIFFCLHSNVDRLWEIYRRRRNYCNEFNDKDWLESTFVFYDENKEVVKVQVKDSLNINNFCYTYEASPTPWLDAVPKKKLKTKPKGQLVQVKEFGSGPRALDRVIQVILTRPKKSRSKEEKKAMSEVLLIDGIEVTDSNEARFDVYVDALVGSDRAGPDKGNFVGSFVRLPEAVKAMKAKGKKGQFKLGLTGVLEENEIEDAEKILLTLVPRVGKVTIGGVSVLLFQNDVNCPYG